MNEAERQKLVDSVNQGLGIYAIEIIMTPEGTIAVRGSRNDFLFQLLPKDYQDLINGFVRTFAKSVDQVVKDTPNAVQHVIDDIGLFDYMLDADVLEEK